MKSQESPIIDDGAEFKDPNLQKFFDLQSDIDSLESKIKRVVGVKETETGLAAPALWDLETDKKLLQSSALQIARIVQIIEPTEEEIKEAEALRLENHASFIGMSKEELVDKFAPNTTYVISIENYAKFRVKLNSKLPKTGVEVGMRVAVNPANMEIMVLLPPRVDATVSAMEVEERPDITYEDIGGCTEQLERLREVLELPLLNPERYADLGIDPPRGVLLYGPPGTGKTLTARAVANRADACFIRVNGTELLQRYIGEGARIVRELFKLARTKKACIIFFDEVDSWGASRFNNEGSANDSEVQRTMLELINQLDGFSPRGNVKVIMATNRPDILDPALTRPGRIDRKILYDIPDIEGRAHILKIHCRKMACAPDIRFNLLSQLCEDATGADLKAVCVEAGMYAIRERRKQVTEEDLIKAIHKVIKGQKQFSATAEYLHYQ